MAWEWITKAIPVGAWVLRKAQLGRVIVVVRDRATLGILAPFHFQVVHAMQQLSASMTTKLPDGQDAATQLAIRVCNECRMLMGHALELNANELHCCFKVMVSGTVAGDRERVATWVRSEPLDDRPVETGEANSHEVGKNTVWSSLMGVSDGKTNWRPFPCFACNDLPAAGENFQCDRKDWQQYYKSSLVFPLRYTQREQSAAFINMGFLAFDSPKCNAFAGIPNIFDFIGSPSGFQDALEKRMAFNLGAAMADVLSACVRPHYDKVFQTEPTNATA